MRICVINPNTTTSMTDKIGDAAQRAASPGTEIVALTSPSGPESIESHFDESLSVPGLLELIRQGEAEGYDGYVIACFGDPGLLAARELTSKPVVGIAEAAMRIASLISTHFSVVTTLSRTIVIAEHLARQYGVEHLCRRIRAADVAVLELEDPASDSYKRVRDEAQRALVEDGAGAIVLGCGGMADLARCLSEDLGVPVIDGVSAAVKLVEALVELRLGTSKVGDLAYPLPKRFTGQLAYLSH
ncbi:aspartate/glutamate racemase family protein [Neisseriaceae bacterium JH1-16]|nr:aspartate/glutamate racemase family protein [Neisseriaceae bacterium JH1-16]